MGAFTTWGNPKESKIDLNYEVRRQQIFKSSTTIIVSLVNAKLDKNSENLSKKRRIWPWGTIDDNKFNRIEQFIE